MFKVHLIYFGSIIISVLASSQSQSKSDVLSQNVAPLSNPSSSILMADDAQRQAEDRHLNWLKNVKRKKRKRFKYLKKHLKKCDLPFKFNIIKKSDDDYEDPDIVRIKLPYGFGDEYFPEAQRKNEDTNSLEEDLSSVEDYDDDYKDDSPGNFTTDTTPSLNQLNVRKPIALRKVPPNFFWPKARIPPFKPIRGPIPLIPSLRRRPWLRVTPWRLARPGSYPRPYFLREPYPGLMAGSPPAPNLPFTPEKIIPVTPSSSSKPFYSQQDYALTGIYQVPSTEIPGSFSDDNVEINGERIVTVTPTSIWVGSPNVSTMDHGKWQPMLDDSKFRIVVPEIITAKYPADELPEIVAAKTNVYKN